MTATTASEIDRLANRYSKRGLSEPEKLRLVQAIIRANEKSATRTTHGALPEEYMTLSEIETSLVNRMWAGFGAAELAAQALRKAAATGKRSLGHGPRRGYVAEALKRAFLTGVLTLYVAVDPTRFEGVPSTPTDPIPVPKHLIGHVFIGVAGRMPGSFAVPPSRKAVGNDQLFAMIQCGRLVVRKSEFTRWLRLQRRKRRWPSQRIAQCARNPVGRPNKETPTLKAAILDIVRQQAWHGERPLTELHRLLVGRGLPLSVDTIGRVIGRMFMETGNPGLRRAHRVRRS